MYQYICIPSPKKKNLWKRSSSPKEGKESPNHEKPPIFSGKFVENSGKPSKARALKSTNSNRLDDLRHRWTRQGRLTCVGFYSQGLNHFSSFFFYMKKHETKKTSTRFFLPFFDFLCLLQVVFRFFSWLSSFPRSPPQRPLLEGYPPAFFTGFRERKHQKEQK